MPAKTAEVVIGQEKLYGVQLWLPDYGKWVFYEEVVEYSSLEVEQRLAVFTTYKEALKVAAITDHVSRVVVLKDFVVRRTFGKNTL